MKKVFEVTTGYEHQGGYDRNFVKRTVIAENGEKAIEKMKSEHSLIGGEIIESVDLVAVIDIE